MRIINTIPGLLLALSVISVTKAQNVQPAEPVVPVAKIVLDEEIAEVPLGQHIVLKAEASAAIRSYQWMILGPGPAKLLFTSQKQAATMPVRSNQRMILGPGSAKLLFVSRKQDDAMPTDWRANSKCNLFDSGKTLVFSTQTGGDYTFVLFAVGDGKMTHDEKVLHFKGTAAAKGNAKKIKKNSGFPVKTEKPQEEAKPAVTPPKVDVKAPVAVKPVRQQFDFNHAMLKFKVAVRKMQLAGQLPTQFNLGLHQPANTAVDRVNIDRTLRKSIAINMAAGYLKMAEQLATGELKLGTQANDALVDMTLKAQGNHREAWRAWTQELSPRMKQLGSQGQLSNATKLKNAYIEIAFGLALAAER